MNLARSRSKRSRFEPFSYPKTPRRRNSKGSDFRFAALEPVQPVKIPYGFQLAITYFFMIHGVLGLAYYVRRNWFLIVQTHKMSWYYGESVLDRLAVFKSAFILSVGISTVVLESKTFLDYVSGSRVQFRPVSIVSIVLCVLCITQDKTN